MKVIFQDSEGHEITRVGDFGGRQHSISPIIVQDEYGRELYRTGGSYPSSSRTEGKPRHRRHHARRYEEDHMYRKPRHSASRSAERPRRQQTSASDRTYARSEPPTIVLIDSTGRQIPIMPRGRYSYRSE
ncbi:hypothetical protein C8J57DRAFT_743617 [Mycena rebaudengoi]|nr:hypothetical protein C8J57DRAFT_743617 [Mycena rebaudengoi]